MVTFFPTLPKTTELHVTKMWSFGDEYVCSLFKNVQSLDGSYRYPYVIEVHGPFPTAKPDLPLIMTSETGGGTFHLCAFTSTGRINFGNSLDWGIEEKFCAIALQLIKEKLHLSCDPKELTIERPPKAKRALSILPIIPSFLAFAVAPFNFVNSRGIHKFDGWRLIFTASGESLQINTVIWAVQLGLAVAVGVWLFKASKR